MGFVEAVEVGEKITVRYPPNRDIEEFVRETCENKHGGHWYCATCKEHIPNQFMKDTHVKYEGGPHKLVWICHECGVPEKP